MSNDTTALAEAQSQPAAQPTAGTAEQAAPENRPSLSHEEQLDQLSPDSTEAAIALLSPDRRKAVGVDGGETAPQAKTAEPAPVEPAAVEPAPPESIDPEDAKPGRIRIDKLSDARTREIVAFLSRNHDATYEDALAATEPPKPAAPAPASTAAGPDLNALTARVAELIRQIKAANDPLAEDFGPDKMAELQEQLIEARLDVRFAKRDAEQRAVSVQSERAQTRQSSVAKAVGKCPEINDPASPQGREFSRLYAQYQATNDPILHNDNCAWLIALEAMDATGYVPKSASSSTPPVSASPAPVTPAAAAPAARAPIPVVRNPAPVLAGAPGSSRLATAATPSPDAFLKAIDDLDGDSVADLIGRLTPSADAQRKRFSYE